MTHFSEIFTADAISALRNIDASQTIENDNHPVPGIYFSWDDSQGSVGLSLTSPRGRLGHLRGAVAGNPRWLSFNLSLGKSRFQAGDVLGLIFEIAGCEGHVFSPVIRSRNDAGDIADTALEDSLAGSGERVLRTLLHTVTPGQALTGPAGYHTLILPLPRKAFDLELGDLRLFVVPAARGLRSTPDSLSSFG